MKKAVMKVTSPLRLVSLELGEKLAWWLLLVMLGFIAGWISSNLQWSQMLCFPVV